MRRILVAVVAVLMLGSVGVYAWDLVAWAGACRSQKVRDAISEGADVNLMNPLI